MFVEGGRTYGETTSQERRDISQPATRVLGHVVKCDGSRASIAADAGNGEDATAARWTVGRMISINLGDARTVGLVYSIERNDCRWDPEGANPITVSVELIGEVRDLAGKAVFDRGITVYPPIGAVAHRIRTRDLRAVYDLAGRHAVTIGSLSQDETIDACIAIDDTLTRHFAVVGTTGVGKSSAVSLLLRKTIAERPDLRVLIMDPHNEFATAFGDQAFTIDANSLDLPFWLFRLDELVEVLFRGHEPVADEVDLLRDLIPLAKQMYRNPASGNLLRRAGDGGGLTADTPVPYRIADVLKEIDDRVGMLETKNDRPIYKSLRARIDSAINDPRYRFMFSSRLIEDTIHQTIARIFRVPHNGKPVTCFEMAGLPSEVVNSVCSVLARLAFDLALWSQGKLKLLLLCEEAHRYMPSDPKMGFAPTRRALSRIAKEGRKYGCYLGVVTQRPGELDPTILSQCSTVFAMRLSNDHDQSIIRSAIADSSASTLSFLSSMGQREAIAFGEGVAATMRMKFEQLPQAFIPGTAAATDLADGSQDDTIDLVSIVERLRNVGQQVSTQAAEPAAWAAPVQEAQAGDPGYRPSAANVPVYEDSGRFGRRSTDRNNTDFDNPWRRK